MAAEYRRVATDGRDDSPGLGGEANIIQSGDELKGAPGGLTTHRFPLSPNGVVYGHGASDDIRSERRDINMAAQFDDASLTGPTPRQRDYLNLPPLPQVLGFSRFLRRRSADGSAAPARALQALIA